MPIQDPRRYLGTHEPDHTPMSTDEWDAIGLDLEYGIAHAQVAHAHAKDAEASAARALADAKAARQAAEESLRQLGQALRRLQYFRRGRLHPKREA